MTGVWQIGLNLLRPRDNRRDVLYDAGSKPVAMPRGEPIEADGLVLGFAVRHELGVRFLATDALVSEMDQSIWPTVAHASRLAHQLFKSRRKAPLTWWP
jgi:hypothetical protein